MIRFNLSNRNRQRVLIFICFLVYSFPVLDLYRESGINPIIPVLRERYMPDGLHPNDAGYEKLSYIVENFLRTHYHR